VSGLCVVVWGGGVCLGVPVWGGGWGLYVARVLTLHGMMTRRNLTIGESAGENVEWPCGLK